MKTDKIKDAQLVEAYKAGDTNALNALVKRWHIAFCKKAYWIVKDADLSKDIAQETWRIVIDKIDHLKDVGSFGSWALRIVCTKSFDALRVQSRKQSKEYELSKNQPTAAEEVEVEEEALKRLLLKAITQLSKQQQLVIRLFYTEEYSLKDISKTLNISVGTVKSRLFHAREKLKLILKQKNYEN